MTRYFLDEEFIDDGKTIELISIGIVCEDGRELYLQSCQFPILIAPEWVRENVLPHLSICPHIPYRSERTAIADHIAHYERGQCTFSRDNIIGAHADCFWRTREQLRNEVQHFISDDGSKVELWGWCSSYDHVALCQLFGTMMDAPAHFPHHMNDIQYLLDERGISDDELPKQEGQTHNALEDARQIKKIWEWLHASHT